jgi:hypothetical protein
MTFANHWEAASTASAHRDNPLKRVLFLVVAGFTRLKPGANERSATIEMLPKLQRLIFFLRFGHAPYKLISFSI